MATYTFTKMQGAGNDFVVFDALQHPIALSADQIKSIADRHFGIGCDQVLLIEPPSSKNTDVRYRIFNADGDEVDQCGNGARCIARYLYDLKYVAPQHSIIAETNVGTITLYMDEAQKITVNMGIPDFDPSQCIKTPSSDLDRDHSYQLNFQDQLIEFHLVSLGNPHAVTNVSDINDANVVDIGRWMQDDKMFFAGINVGFVEIVDSAYIKLRVYERGVGETLACGSGACAAMAVSYMQGLLASEVMVQLPGGSLKISWEGTGRPIYLAGDAKRVFEGTLSL